MRVTPSIVEQSTFFGTQAGTNPFVLALKRKTVPWYEIQTRGYYQKTLNFALVYKNVTTLTPV